MSIQSHNKHNHFKIRWFRLLCITGIAVSVVMLVVIFAEYSKDRAAYRAAQAHAVMTPAATAVQTPLPPETTATPIPLPTSPITVDFDAIRLEGSHVRGWLYSEGTAIHYPVTYYTNNTYYLTHDYTGTRSKGGALFFDTRVGKELVGDNLIIYGHHMKDGSMFKSLMEYQNQAYYDTHPTLYLLTLYGNFRIDVFSGRFFGSDVVDYPVWFESNRAKEAYIRSAIANSTFVPQDVEYHGEQRMISLVTCAYSDYIEDSKYVVQGWLVPIG